MRWMYASVLLTAAAMGSLQGCTAVVVGGAAATAVVVAQDRRTTGTMVDDQSIELKALAAIADDPELQAQSHVNVTSFNGIVLLTGEAPTLAMHIRIQKRVEGIEKVRKVYNEITVAAPSSLLTRSSDSVITSKIKTKMLAEKKFNPARVKVVTENGTVYLMGLVSREEARVGTELSRSVSGVQRVVRLFEYQD